MKKFHKKTVVSVASAILLSSGLLLSMQASATSTQVDVPYQRCDIRSKSAVDAKITQPFLIFDSFKNSCRTPRMYFNKGQIAHTYAAVCGNDDRSVPAEAIVSIKTAAEKGDYDRSYINLSIYSNFFKSTEQQGVGRPERLMHNAFTIPVAGYYVANIVTYLDHSKNYDVKKLKLLEARAFITNNPRDIPRDEFFTSLCDDALIIK